MKKNNFREFILIYTLIIVFMVSLLIIHIDYRVDKLGTRIDYVESTVNRIANSYGD